MSELFLQDVTNRVSSTLDHLKKELSAIRAGRANPTMVEDLSVEAYGSRMKLMEVANIAAPQTSLLTIQVYDTTLVHAVEKAITESNLGLNPAVDGQMIRLSLPPLTEERREEFSKMAHQRGEEARIALRQIRGDARDGWGKEKEAGDLGEDELFRREKMLQTLVDDSVAQVEELVKHKVEELKQI